MTNRTLKVCCLLLKGRSVGLVLIVNTMIWSRLSRKPVSGPLLNFSEAETAGTRSGTLVSQWDSSKSFARSWGKEVCKG